MDNFRVLGRLSRPTNLLLASLTFFMGAGIAHYLGYMVHLAILALSLLAVLAIQTAAYWLVEYFHLPFKPLGLGETARLREAFRTLLFQSIIALLTVSGVIIVTLLLVRSLSLFSGTLFGLIVISYIAFSVPPLNLSEKGYGELVQAVAWGTLIPSYSFLLQSVEFHRLLPFATIPVTLLALAYLLLSDFPFFVKDQKLNHQSLILKLTWQRSILVHHLLVLLSFLFFSLTPLLGFPWILVWPVFLALPFGLFQILWLQRIAAGGKALWNFFIPFSAAVFGLSVYLLTINFWTR
jgi:1,4-dihydroxy-2-naphthoate octaprenyltransferase